MPSAGCSAHRCRRRPRPRPRPRRRPMPESAPLRAAILGTGAIANAHAVALAAAPDAELVAVGDRDVEHARAFAERWGVAADAVFDSLDALLASGRVDVLHICTPPGVHAEQAIAALDAGLHVVCEKPAALSLDE